MVQSELALQFTGHGCSALPENAADTVYFMEGEDGHLYTGWADGHQGPIEVACSGPGAKTGWSLFKGSTPRDLRLIDHGAVAAPGGYDPPHTARGGGFAAGSQSFAAAGGGFAAAAGGAAAGDGGASGGGSASVELAGRYPCAGGSFDGVLYQGTYAEDNGANVQGRACPQSCGGDTWCIGGMTIGWQYSTDKGKTWTLPALNSSSNVFNQKWSVKPLAPCIDTSHQNVLENI